jgi:hypothetical protein
MTEQEQKPDPRNEVLRWLATEAGIDGLAGFRDGYAGVSEQEAERMRGISEQRRGGQNYIVGYRHGLTVSPHR